jgi:cysteine desulfurase
MAKRIYLDFAASTPIDGGVLKVTSKLEKKIQGNPSSVHQEGVFAKEALESARRSISLCLKTHTDEIVFTSGATESNGLAILGVIKKAKEVFPKPHVISSSVEHSSVLSLLRGMEKSGEIELTLISPSKNSLCPFDEVEKSIKSHTALITLSLVNGEMGGIIQIRKIGNLVRKIRTDKKDGVSSYPVLHTDCSQAVGILSIEPNNLFVDLLTIDASKFYGPKGIGLLYVKRLVPISPIFVGGGQEKGLRPGTQNVIGIVGMSVALEKSEKLREKEFERIKKLRDIFLSEAKKNILGIIDNSELYESVPSIANLCCKGLNAEFAVVELDAKGVSASSASACQSANGEGYSYVISALPESGECSSSSIRFSFGRDTKVADVKKAVSILKEVVSGNAISK